MQYLYYLLAIYPALFVIHYAIIFLRLCKLRFQYPKYQLQKAEKVPDHLKKVFTSPIKELEQFGFKPCSYLQVEGMVKLYPFITWEVLLYHKILQTYAVIAIHRPIGAVNLFSIEFYTVFQDRSLLLTMNGKAYSMLGEIPNCIIQDPYTHRTSFQWQAHQDKLNQLTATKTLCSLERETFTKVLQISYKNYIDSLINTKDLLSIKESELFEMNLLSALKTTHNLIQGSSKIKAIAKARRQQTKTDISIQVEIPIELEVEAFRRQESLEQGKMNNKWRFWLLLVSLVLFLTVYTRILEPQRLVILTAVILLHECGHLWAMSIFRYRDISMLFIPFFGAAAIAHKEEATLTQKFWVLLAGPLPGLLLGIGLLQANRKLNNPVWIEAAWMLIELNLFNLLPIYPLDGGKIADLLLFSRHPYINVLFKITCVIILGLLGLFQSILLLLAILIAVTIPHSFRSAKINTSLQKDLQQNPPTNRDHLLHSIFKHLKQLDYLKLTFIKRYTLAKDLIQRHHESHSKWTTRAFLTVLYFGSLLGGITSTLQIITPHWASLISYSLESPKARLEHYRAKAQKDVESATAALRSNPNDINAYLQRAKAHIKLRDFKGVLADYDQIVRLDPSNISYRLTRAGFRSNVRDYQGALVDYSQVLHLNPKDINAYRRRAQTYITLRDYKSAVNDYTQIIELDPQDFWIYIERGYARQDLGDYQGALADANYFIKLQPNEPDAYVLRSKVRHLLGDEQGARTDTQKAETLDKVMTN